MGIHGPSTSASSPSSIISYACASASAFVAASWSTMHAAHCGSGGGEGGGGALGTRSSSARQGTSRRAAPPPPTPRTCTFTGLSRQKAHIFSSGFHVCSCSAPESCTAA